MTLLQAFPSLPPSLKFSSPSPFEYLTRRLQNCSQNNQKISTFFWLCLWIHRLPSQWKLDCWRKKTGEPEKKISVQGREPATKPINIRSRRQDLNLDHKEWEVCALTTALTTVPPLLPELMYAFIKRLLNQKGVGYISLALVWMMEYTLLPGSHFYKRDCLYEVSQPGLLYHAGSAHALFS